MIIPILQDAAREGHCLRSQFLNAFIPIEIWADETARQLSEKIKPTAPLGQKLTLIASEAKADKSKFAHPHHVLPLIERVRKMSDRRSNLVHAKLVTANTDEGTFLWMFRNIASQKEIDAPFQITFDKPSFEKVIKDLGELATSLQKQKIKALLDK
jgi:hypothetical protein